MNTKIFRITTVPSSLAYLLKGQLKFLNQYYNVTAIASDDDSGLWETIATNEKIECHSIRMNREINLSGDCISLVKLYKYLKKEKPLIVHSMTPKAGLLSMMAARLAGIPIRMHTFTGLIFPYRTGILQKILITTDKLLCRCATHIYPEGEGVKKDLLKFNITHKPLKILANGNVNGIDINYYSTALFSSTQKKQLREELNIHENDFVFIFVGRLVGDKGINELIRAFCDIKYEHAKLLLVGRYETRLDPLHKDTLELIESNKNIICTGFQPDVRPYMAISDAFVFPSYREGFPNVVMQAGAMELPSIVTNISGCNEIIIEGENGTIIPPKDAEALKNKMMEFIENGALCQTLKKNTRNMIASRYQQDMVWNALLNEYKLLEKQNSEKNV